jgi:uncharacterized protein
MEATFVTAGFIGRTTELALLDKRLARIAAQGEGGAIAIRGRRQVGKSRLVQEFCNRASVPYLYYAATRGASGVESIRDFLAEFRSSGLAGQPDLVPDVHGWPDAFRVLAAALPDRPSIVVLDEVPWLSEQEPVFDGALQTAWDRQLSRKPVLLLLLGSDLHMMERMTSYEQPFYGRADSLLLGPLNPAETGTALGLVAGDAIDAYLMTGGLPGILRAWPSGTPALTFAESECSDPASALFGVPETALLAEFPAPDAAGRVLEAIGGSERTFAKIASLAGNADGAVPSGTLSPLLRRLADARHVIAIDEPLSVSAGKPALYRVADSSLRFYLGLGRRAQDLSRRGRPGAAMSVLRSTWSTWRGRAVEPVIREALSLTAAELPWPMATAVGGWWNRAFDPEIDLVGADRAPVAQTIFYAGSVKWLNGKFDNHDLAGLLRSCAAIPGFGIGGPLVGVSLSGFSPGVAEQLALAWTAHDVVAAYPA